MPLWCSVQYFCLGLFGSEWKSGYCSATCRNPLQRLWLGHTLLLVMKCKMDLHVFSSHLNMVKRSLDRMKIPEKKKETHNKSNRHEIFCCLYLQYFEVRFYLMYNFFKIYLMSGTCIFYRTSLNSLYPMFCKHLC